MQSPGNKFVIRCFMSFVRFLFSKVFFRHLLMAAGITLALIFITWKGLAIYTRHGKNIVVPDYTGITLTEIEYYRMGHEFEFVVLDSVYDNTLPPGAIVMQDPLPGSLVKKNRKIYLTTVAILPEQVAMPDLVDLTFRQALSTLETYGLYAGKLEYVPDIAKNAVLQQLHDGVIIPPGTHILKGSAVDLVLGQGLGSEKVPVPFLLGLTQQEAHQLIRENYLNIGANIFDAEPDTTARVYKQNPVWQRDAYVNMGQQIDLWYHSGEDFNFDSLLLLYVPDTLLFDDSTYYDPNIEL